MAKKTESGFSVGFSGTEAEVFKRASEKIKHADETGNMSWGDYTFQITVDNMLNLETLFKYAQMLDYVTKSKGEDCLNMDGVVNEVLEDALTKRVKELAKKHGFENHVDFSTALSDCKDGEEVSIVIKESEQEAYQRAHNKILMHIPFDDRQQSLFDYADKASAK